MDVLWDADTRFCCVLVVMTRFEVGCGWLGVGTNEGDSSYRRAHILVIVCIEMK